MNAIDTDVATAIAQEVAAQVGELRYNLWFKDNAKIELNDHEVVVGVPNLFFQEWFSSNFLGALRRAAEQVMGRRIPVRLLVDAELFRAMRSAERPAVSDEVATAPEHLQAPSVATPRRGGRRLQTLDDFVVGASNRVAHAAAMRLVADPTAQFNPLVVYGSLGLGKTHLLRGIVHALRERYRGMQVTYLSAESFTNSFLEDMRGGRLSAFRQRARGTDVLLVDDVQFMGSKKATQNELLHTFEALDAEGKPVVLVADRHPRLIEEFSDQLRDRMVAGMCCPVEPPDYETRVGILEMKSHAVGLQLDREVIEFVANHFRANVRELVGALHSLKAHAEHGRSVDLAATREALAELLRHSPKTVNVADVEQATCQTFEIKEELLRSATRARNISQPRMLAMYLARKYTSASYEAIGRHFGGRNHATVIFAERKVRTWIEQSSEIDFGGRRWRIAEALRVVEDRLR